ncbi:MAG: hypothetical protein D6B28_11485 [Gammaproteobacteria bacterium]|nr:MAG: hypothetical protein D6B28_11485 [Gammaproteobacteria bacterium]
MRFSLRLFAPFLIATVIICSIKPVVAEVGRPASARSVPEFIAHKRKKVAERQEQEQAQEKQQAASDKTPVKTTPKPVKKPKQINKTKPVKKVIANKNTSKKIANKKKSSKKVARKSAFKPKVYIDKVRYSPGEKIMVSFKASKGYGENAWIGVVPSGVSHGSAEENDLNAVSYQYMDKQTKGKMTFQAPIKYGTYDIRMHDDEFGKEVAFVTFEVKESTGTLALNKKKYKTGEAIKVKFTAPSWFSKDAWIGLMRSTVPHNNVKLSEKHDLEKYTIDNRINGVMVFTVYLYSGEYDIRMFDSKDGSEITFVTFVVE